MMFLQVSPLFRFFNNASYGLDLVVDFGPLLMLIVGLAVLGTTIVTAIYDTQEAKHHAQEATVSELPFTKAA